MHRRRRFVGERQRGLEDVLANDTDPDGGRIEIRSVSQPRNGTVVITNGGAA